MRIPPDWTTRRASGWWELHHLTHTPCGYESQAVDLICSERDARVIVYGHQCKGSGDGGQDD